MSALPHALLIRPEYPFPDPPFHWDPNRKIPGRLNMALSTQVAAVTHPSSIARSKMCNKIKTAISLVVIRGANVRRDDKGKPVLIFDKDDVGEKWLLHSESGSSFVIGLDS